MKTKHAVFSWELKNSQKKQLYVTSSMYVRIPINWETKKECILIGIRTNVISSYGNDCKNRSYKRDLIERHYNKA